MTRFISLRLFIILCGTLLVHAQIQDPVPRHREERETRLPNGKKQQDEIVKADKTHNIEDVQKIADLAAELKQALEKNSEFVVSVADLKKLDEIEKLTKRVRGRLKRY